MTTTLSPAEMPFTVLIDEIGSAIDALEASLDASPNADVLAPQLREEFAILLPRGRWWRKLSLRLAEPEGRGPSIFRDRQSAENEMFDVSAMARGVFGVRRRDYRLRLMVRNVRISDTGATTTSPWRPADVLADTTAVR
ncbi:hypothetical protein ACQP0C_41675 (plasmid) [Nocardia sp. CA-129566]|uniref:hypothetical protein n=1 Tax=Nocardia sp. CA-129566 TaxID=3239976 RepID=UPI003D9800DD